MKEITDDLVRFKDTISIRETNLTASRLKNMIDNYEGEDEKLLEKISETEDIEIVTLYNALILYEGESEKTTQSNIFEFGESQEQ